ncbi:MAG: hypothetical protein EZS28_015837 [Streblomastix strix]|uniref:DM10 domain-containing protein n=1 Tax=Streblomastix strix TaxID=222440 RepID=A0A5J4W1A6_9EUKA|nr:MAG: hypothetical protein EZS28_015837 [Streblomastix strix]
MDAPRTTTITAADLMIGRIVNIFNRPLLLYDCDEYTENYYRTAYGITEFSNVKLPELINIAPESIVESKMCNSGISQGNKIRRLLIPKPGEVNSFYRLETEEDIMKNVQHLNPQPPKRDLEKRTNFERVVFSLKAHLLQFSRQDEKRRFTLNSFLGNDTFSVFEPLERNVGIANVPIPMLPAYPMEADLDRVIAEVKTCMRKTFLSLTSLLDPDMTYTASKHQFIDVMSQS